MSDESPNPYAAVIADLRAKRDQIDQALKVLEALTGEGAAIPNIPAQPHQSAGVQPMPNGSNEPIAPGAFHGMSIPTATKKLLLMRKRAMGNQEIVDALVAGGLHLTSASPINTVGSILGRQYREGGDIVRIGRGVWGLQAWYPTQRFVRD